MLGISRASRSIPTALFVPGSDPRAVKFEDLELADRRRETELKKILTLSNVAEDGLRNLTVCFCHI